MFLLISDCLCWNPLIFEMSESLNISFEHSAETEATVESHVVVPKMEPGSEYQQNSSYTKGSKKGQCNLGDSGAV